MKKRRLHLGLLLITVLFLSAAAVANEQGQASYYADSLHGNLTASGEPYDRDDLTAAHRTLAFGTRVKVTNLDNGESVVLRINDRGPHVDANIIDVSGSAAERLDMVDAGTAQVSLEVLEQ